MGNNKSRQRERQLERELVQRDERERQLERELLVERLRQRELQRELQCPVCLEIPDGLIYQCGNGHIICDSCSKRVDDHCPQCRVSLDAKSRNRAMEGLVGGVEVSCKRKEQGCKAVMSLKDLASHLENDCEFGPAKIFSLCQILEFPCDFSSSRADAIYSHISEEHQVPAYLVHPLGGGTNKFIMVVRLGDFVKRLREPATRANFCIDGTAEVPFDEGSSSSSSTSSPAKFLVSFYANVAKGYVSVICLHLGQEDKAATKGLGVTTELRRNEIPNWSSVQWSWSGRPTHYLNAVEDACFSNPLFQVQISNLLEMLGEADDDRLLCSITFYKC